MYHFDIPKTRQYDTGKIEVIARSSAGEAVSMTELKVIPRHDDYRGVLKNAPRRKFLKNLRGDMTLILHLTMSTNNYDLGDTNQKQLLYFPNIQNQTTHTTINCLAQVYPQASRYLPSLCLKGVQLNHLLLPALPSLPSDSERGMN